MDTNVPIIILNLQCLPQIDENWIRSSERRNLRDLVLVQEQRGVNHYPVTIDLVQIERERVTCRSTNYITRDAGLDFD